MSRRWRIEAVIDDPDQEKLPERRLVPFRYITGANLARYQKIAMTAPVQIVRSCRDDRARPDKQRTGRVSTRFFPPHSVASARVHRPIRAHPVQVPSTTIAAQRSPVWPRRPRGTIMPRYLPGVLAKILHGRQAARCSSSVMIRPFCIFFVETQRGCVEVKITAGPTG